MSEYVKIDPEPTDDPDVMELYINQTLTRLSEEVYEDLEEGENGSPIAQMLFDGVEGIAALTILPDCLIITREEDAAWETIIDDVRDALRDFFL